MALCKSEILCHIIKQLGAHSDCDTDLAEIIPDLWDMVCLEAGGNCHLQALLTKREAVLVLLGCASYTVDVSESHYVMNAETKADSKNDYHSQAQSTGSYNKFAIGTGGTRYDEKSTAQTDADSLRVGRAQEKTDGDSFYRDDGRGYGFNRSHAFNAIDNQSTSDNFRDTQNRYQEDGYRRDCNYEYSRNQTDGASGFFLILGGSFTGSGSEWRKYTKTSALSTQLTINNTVQTETDQSTGLTTGRGTHRWESNFQADIDWYEKEFVTRFHNERFDSRRLSTANSSGDGDGIYEEKTRSHTASQGTALQTGRSDSTRTSTRTSSLSAFSISNSHRFQNLLNIYDQLKEQIDHLRKRLRSNSPPAIATLPCNCRSTCSCELRRMGLYAVQTYGCSKTCITGANIL